VLALWQQGSLNLGGDCHVVFQAHPFQRRAIDLSSLRSDAKIGSKLQ
jgi:hypothetical protein